MKKVLITAALILFAAIAAMTLGDVFGDISFGNDAEFAPVSVTVVVVPEFEAQVLAIIYDEMNVAHTKVEITTTAELMRVMESIIASELNKIIMITPILRTPSRKYERLENQLHPVVRGSSVIALGDRVRFVNTIGLTNLRQ